MVKSVSRQTRYYRRMREAGISRVSVWVPKTKRAEFFDAYDTLADCWRASGALSDPMPPKTEDSNDA